MMATSFLAIGFFWTRRPPPSPSPPSLPPPDARSTFCAHRLGDNVHDAVPIRASLAVMSHVASLAAGRTFVEIGSRHGDLIECVTAPHKASPCVML